MNCKNSSKRQDANTNGLHRTLRIMNVLKGEAEKYWLYEDQRVIVGIRI